jgi:hypothetical protein
MPNSGTWPWRVLVLHGARPQHEQDVLAGDAEYLMSGGGQIVGDLAQRRLVDIGEHHGGSGLREGLRGG